MKSLSLTIFFSLSGANIAFTQGPGLSGGFYYNAFYSTSLETVYHPDFSGGINYEFKTGKDFYIKTEIKYISKNFHVNDMPDKLKLDYISVQVKIVFKPSLGKSKMIVGGGAFIAYGFSRKRTPYDLFDNMEPETDQVALKPFDYGLTLITGHQLTHKFRISFNVDAGFANISRKKDNSITTGSFGLDIGYKLFNKKNEAEK